MRGLTFFRVVVIASFSLTVALFTSTQTNAADERPNIVLIMCDDMGYSDIGCYGGEVDMPNLNRMAKVASRQRRHNSPVPTWFR